jgi:peroxiredoxin Q/BCP
VDDEEMKIRSILGLIMLTSLFSTLKGFASVPLEVGAHLPKELNATLHTGETVDLGELMSEGLTLVFFYPKANTPGCTAQACSLRDAHEDLIDRGVRVFGVSADTVAAQAKFQADHHLPYPLVADPDRIVALAFGSPSFARQAFLIKDGVLVWRDLRASTGRQAEDVLKALGDLNLL